VKRRRGPTARTRAVEALRQVLEKGQPAAPLVADFARGLSAADQDLLRELALGVLRWKDALDAEIAGVSRVPLARLAPNLREILEVALYQLRHLDRVPPYAAVSEAVEQARASGGEGAARLVNGILRGILLLPAPTPPHPDPLPPGGERGNRGLPLRAGEGRSEGRPTARELARFYSHPPFLVERWLERFGAEATRRVLQADNTAPLLDLLADPRRSGREDLRAALLSEGIATEPSPLSPLALTVLRGHPLRSRLFAEGRFAVQDVGSVLLPLLLPEGDWLVDLAAAPGGKSLSAVLHGRARRTVALDRSIARLGRVVENVRRLDLPAIRPVGGEFSAVPLGRDRWDRVLLDAPCSGTGTLRKNPEIRYRLSEAAIERISALQEQALGAALELLAPGGFLLYATCSLEAEENERVVERVLARSSGFSPAAIEPPDALRPLVAGSRFRILPDSRADGFTAHLIRREAGPAAAG
jgi:16S rRNA (cytosine967-C5)-methyltransferase